MNTKEIGDVSEASVIAHFLKRGFLVSVPFGDRARYDLVVEAYKKLYRIQIKTIQYYPSFLQLRAYSITTKNGKYIKNVYSSGEVDYVVGYCRETDKVYIISPEELNKSGMVTLHLDGAQNNQKLGIKNARDFELSENELFKGTLQELTIPEPIQKIKKQQIRRRKVKERPNKETLMSMLENSNYTQLGKHFGVSGNAVKKWLK